MFMLVVCNGTESLGFIGLFPASEISDTGQVVQSYCYIVVGRTSCV